VAETKEEKGEVQGLSQEELKKPGEISKAENGRRFSSYRNSQNNVRVMHGSIVRDVPEDKEKIVFSMLQVNPDHFSSTKDKYRQFFVKKPLAAQPETRDFRQLWRVLNLENIVS
jgi:hypothetical protein